MKPKCAFQSIKQDLSFWRSQFYCQKTTVNNVSKRTNVKPDCNQSCVVLRNEPFCLNVCFIFFFNCISTSRGSCLCCTISVFLPLFLTIWMSLFRTVVKEKIHVQQSKFQIRTNQSVNRKVSRYVNVVDVLYFFVFPFVVLFYTKINTEKHTLK